MSLGEDRIRTTFNPSSDSLVDQFKQKSAELINLCAAKSRMIEGKLGSEEHRLWALAMTAYEEAAMWATKAATHGK